MMKMAGGLSSIMKQVVDKKSIKDKKKVPLFGKV